MSMHPQTNGAAGIDDIRIDPQSLAFIEELYARYVENPQSVQAEWREYFDRLVSAPGNGAAQVYLSPEKLFRRRSLFHQGDGNSLASPQAGGIGQAALQERVDRLIHAYRVRGHIVARIDPLNRPRPETPELDPKFYSLGDADLDRQVAGPPDGRRQPVRQVLKRMRRTYCRSIGVQFMHIDELSVRRWLQQRMEASENRAALERDEQVRILTKLTDAVVFEEFLQKKYVGSKSFSLEGAESLIPLLDMLIEKSGDEGTEEIVLAMAHRGRLNVLANIMGKPPRAIFREFEDVDAELHVGAGDVKYHLGHSSDWTTTAGHKVHLSLCFNPSHLEYINTVALGRMRAKQDRFGDVERRRGLALLIHGDAAFAGEGVVQETLNLSELPGYRVGGTIHVIINNQLGFTTLPAEARSGPYATDVAKMLQAPIFHVNGEDPEAVAQVVRLALDFRSRFQRDAVIDMYCYRRRGHNEGDEPAFTQPVMYRDIVDRDPVREHYLERLLLLGDITVDEADRIAEERRALLERELALARGEDYEPAVALGLGVWAGYIASSSEAVDVETGLPRERLAELLAAQTRLPDDFHPYSKIARWLGLRREMVEGTRPLDWSAGEALALASTAVEGYRVRMSGQDTMRGTFTQRHAVLFDTVDGHAYMPLGHLANDQGPVEIINSPLSEAGVLGFEYGYSLDWPDGLVLWEAQFGDFVNAAQVIIDQFIASAEDKWRRLSGIVLLLPHGFEGQGPEHSSARLERFLALAAEDNIQVVYPTTPAQYFHCLRRQVVRRLRKPLVVMTPKSLLRNAAAVSSLEDLATGTFRTVLPDTQGTAGRSIRRILLCSGKVYYDIVQRRQELERTDVAVLRLEQLYPAPEGALCEALAAYADGTPVVWVQEEPANMGAWRFLRVLWGEALFGRLPFAGVFRPESASPATGSATSHKLEQKWLLDQAFGAG